MSDSVRQAVNIYRHKIKLYRYLSFHISHGRTRISEWSHQRCTVNTNGYLTDVFSSFEGPFLLHKFLWEQHAPRLVRTYFFSQFSCSCECAGFLASLWPGFCNHTFGFEVEIYNSCGFYNLWNMFETTSGGQCFIVGPFCCKCVTIWTLYSKLKSQSCWLGPVIRSVSLFVVSRTGILFCVLFPVEV